MDLNGTVCYLLVSRCLPLSDGENRGGSLSMLCGNRLLTLEMAG